MHRTNLLLISAAAIVVTFSCHAQTPTSLEFRNPNPVGSGARALSQGNAFIAVADDATAASWNPGGLPQLQRPEISFALEAIGQREHTHTRPSGIEQYPLESLNYGSLVIPWFHNGRNYVFSLNYLNLYTFERHLNLPFSNPPIGSPPIVLGSNTLRVLGTYKVEQEGSLSVVAPAFAMSVTPRLLLGLTLNLWHHSLTQSSQFEAREFTTAFQDLNGTVTPFPGNPSVVINRFTVESGQSVVIGSLYRLSRQWAFGGVVKPAFQLHLDHEQLGSNQAPTDTSPDLKFPWIVGLGVAWRPSDALTMSSDVTWSDWSRFRFTKNVSHNPVDGTGRSLTDTFTVRWGSEYLLIFEKLVVPLRCGLGYDPAPAISNVDDYFTVNVGAGIQLFKRLNLDAAYEFRWGNRVNGDGLPAFDAAQDTVRHRVLTSVIWYF